MAVGHTLEHLLRDPDELILGDPRAIAVVSVPWPRSPKADVPFNKSIPYIGSICNVHYKLYCIYCHYYYIHLWA